VRFRDESSLLTTSLSRKLTTSLRNDNLEKELELADDQVSLEEFILLTLA
jgi:hypothetical protein